MMSAPKYPTHSLREEIKSREVNIVTSPGEMVFVSCFLEYVNFCVKV